MRRASAGTGSARSDNAPAPALVAISHGTNSPTGQAAIAALVAAVARSRPDLTVADGFVDVQQPDVAATLGALQVASAAIVVPLLLSAGYHVHVDLQNETAAADRDTHVSHALGPDQRLIEVLADRLGEAGYRAGDELVLAAAGSSDARAVADCREVGRMLAARLGARVTVGFLSAASPRLGCAVAAARIRNPKARVALGSYLMAPGFFFDLTAQVGADLISDPLLVPEQAPPVGLVELVIDRYTEAAASARRLAARAA
ncbi:cobalamin biosynthesis protein CbiX [Cryobacterium frigoriphilum]|uniref:Cobalamin biosynthesis protein CbiX n=1 Tax=Cryobacterium frigoriphilum TaxID=1259150 RepID=A0A4V3IS56_9MICO|nr:CbiX/SirB N-terminal domain-containing protein [Cryobacterium frigoriphilum]TFD55316.1 cobalamin biosynthesis protein CbiX [Cryobacterium frigoriphilum]